MAGLLVKMPKSRSEKDEMTLFPDVEFPAKLQKMEKSQRGRILDIALEIGLKVKDLKITNNIQMLSSIDLKRNLRLQVIFLKADDDILRSLFKCMMHKGKKSDAERVNQFIIENPPGKILDQIPGNLLKDCYGPKGDYYDLESILKEIMKKYTGHIPGIRITWRKESFGRNSITWATFRDFGEGGFIRVNKILDKPDVPRYVIESIIYHEILHHVVPPKAKGRGSHPHTSDFKTMLKKFPHIDEAEEWKKGFFSRKRRISRKPK